jgi:SulP family sulfate permease
MATLAGILIVVAFHMSEFRNFIAVTKGSRSDAAVMGTTFLLTVLIDLTVAIEAGMVLAAFLFLRKIMQASSVQQVSSKKDKVSEDEAYRIPLPAQVDVFEINGPFFFGAAYKFKDAMRIIEKPPQVLILRMGNVPIIDATGIRILREVNEEIRKRGTKLILAEVRSEQVLDELKKTRLMFKIGKANVTESFDKARGRMAQLLDK